MIVAGEAEPLKNIFRRGNVFITQVEYSLCPVMGDVVGCGTEPVQEIIADAVVFQRLPDHAVRFPDIIHNLRFAARGLGRVPVSLCAFHVIGLPPADAIADVKQQVVEGPAFRQ